MQMVSVYRPASGAQVFNEMVNAIVDACNEEKIIKREGCVWGEGGWIYEYINSEINNHHAAQFSCRHAVRLSCQRVKTLSEV